MDNLKTIILGALGSLFAAVIIALGKPIIRWLYNLDSLRTIILGALGSVLAAGILALGKLIIRCSNNKGIQCVLAAEILAFGTVISRWLINKAVMRLPDNDRVRFREELLGHLDEVDGFFAKLRHASGLVFNVKKLRNELREQKADQARLAHIGTSSKNCVPG